MKKYKLIKEYPGSPKLNTEIKEKGKNSWHFNSDKTIINGLQPGKYPKFWEEVVEKDYEILTLKSKDSPFPVISYEAGGEYYPMDYLKNSYESKEEFLFYFLASEVWKINSVKRLSDGEVFTIGDRIKIGYGEQQIENFYIEEGNCKNGIWAKHEIGDTNLCTLKHIKKPLFTTQDGVDIFEGDTFYNTWDLYKPNKEIAIKRKKDFYNEKPVNKHCIYFSSKKAAEEYILMNKPCLSINDILNILNKYKWGDIKTFLTQLVKSKL